MYALAILTSCRSARASCLRLSRSHSACQTRTCSRTMAGRTLRARDHATPLGYYHPKSIGIGSSPFALPMTNLLKIMGILSSRFACRDTSSPHGSSSSDIVVGGAKRILLSHDECKQGRWWMYYWTRYRQLYFFSHGRGRFRSVRVRMRVGDEKTAAHGKTMHHQ